MKNVARLLALCAVFAVALIPVQEAGACCTPCAFICQKGTPPSTPCCSGIPEPDNACGFMNCGKWWRLLASDTALAES